MKTDSPDWNPTVLFQYPSTHSHTLKHLLFQKPHESSQADCIRIHRWFSLYGPYVTLILKQASTKMALILSNANRSIFRTGCHDSALTWTENCNKSTRFKGSREVTLRVTNPRLLESSRLFCVCASSLEVRQPPGEGIVLVLECHSLSTA